MTRTITVIWLLLGLGIGIGTYVLSHRVGELEKIYSHYENQIREDQEALHVLRAEWSYLNDPDRLSDLAERFLSLKPSTHSQVSRFSALPDETPTMFYRIDKYGETVRYLPLPRLRPELPEWAKWAGQEDFTALPALSAPLSSGGLP